MYESRQVRVQIIYQLNDKTYATSYITVFNTARPATTPHT